MKKKTKKTHKHTKKRNTFTFTYIHLALIAIAVIGLIFFVNIISSGTGVLSAQTLLAREGSDDSGGGNNSGSGSSEDSDSGGSGGESGSSGGDSSSGDEVEDQPDISTAPSVSSAPEITPQSQTNTGITKVELQENRTRIEQIIFENGVKKKVEMRNDNGRIRIRIKSEDETTGAETDQRLELRPEDGIARLKVEANGVEQSVKVKALNNLFVIEQEGLGESGIGTKSATTNLPITIDPETNSISVTTQLGTINVQQLPAQAIQQVLSNNTLDTVTSTELGESEESETDSNKQIVYKIAGIKNTKLLGVFKIDAPILAEVSAITGEQTFVDKPWYLKAFGFLFAQ